MLWFPHPKYVDEDQLRDEIAAVGYTVLDMTRKLETLWINIEGIELLPPKAQRNACESEEELNQLLSDYRADRDARAASAYAIIAPVVATHKPNIHMCSLDADGALATLLVLQGILEINDAANAVGVAPEHLVHEALAWSLGGELEI